MLKKMFCPKLKNSRFHGLYEIFCVKNNQRELFEEKLAIYEDLRNFEKENKGKIDKKELDEYKQKHDCTEELSHISNELSISELEGIDLRYGVANSLSRKNADNHKKYIWFLAFFGFLFTMSFVIYDEVNAYWFIFVCFLFFLILLSILRWTKNSQHHKNYLEFRVLAESFRVQFYLSIAGIQKDVVDLMPWFVRKGVPWIYDVLDELNFPKIHDNENKDIFKFWIRNQISYHEYALEKTKRELSQNDSIAVLLLSVTLICYAFAIVFELYMWSYHPGNFNAEFWRMILKVSLGFAAAFTLFLESYYGKKSLEDIYDDYERMKELYIWAEQKIIHEGVSDDVLEELARQFLIENSTWYAYQNQNKPGLVL